SARHHRARQGYAVRYRVEFRLADCAQSADQAVDLFPRSLPAGILCSRDGRPHRRSECGMEGSRAVFELRHTLRVAHRRRQGDQGEDREVPDPPESDRELGIAPSRKPRRHGRGENYGNKPRPIKAGLFSSDRAAKSYDAIGGEAMILCDLCGEAKECLQKEIEGKEYDVCSGCWNPIAEKLKGKGRRKQPDEIILLPSVTMEPPEQQAPKRELPKIWGRTQ